MKFVYEESVTRAEGLQALCERWTPAPREETLMLSEAFGRVSAHEVSALYSLPVKRSSKRDGIAVRSADFADGMPDTSAWQRDRDFAQADTGDDFADAFDAVIAVEDIAYDANGAVRIVNDDVEVASGKNINSRGSIVEEGTRLVDAHVRLTPELVAALAVGGHAQVSVYARPRVAFMATGSELVPWGTEPRRGQNIEANSLLVRGMLEEWGAEALIYPAVRDDEESLDRALDRALEAADIVIVNGGSSRGEEDFNSRMLERRSTYFRHGVRAVPGRPVGMALIDGKPVINVPGPVIAAFLCIDWLVKGLVAHYFGMPVPLRRTVAARLSEAVSKPKPFERLVRVTLSLDAQGDLVCAPVPGSWGVPQTLAEADAMLTLPIGSAGAAAGELVEVELLRPWEVVLESMESSR